MSQILKQGYIYCSKSPQKKWGQKNKNKKIICRVPPRAPGKEAFAGCQVMGHPAKKFKKKLKKFFAGCLTAWHPAKADGRWPPSSRPPLPAAIFCRVAGTRQRPIFADGWNLPSARHPAKAALPEAFLCRVPPGLAPGKEFLCRVPDKKHPANFFCSRQIRRFLLCTER